MTPGAESQPSPVPHLSYGREQSPRLKCWLKRLGLLFWIAVVLLLAWDKWGVMIRVRLPLYLATQGVLNHAEPSTRVVYESDPPEVDHLLAIPGYKTCRISDGLRQGSEVAIYQGMEQRVSEMDLARGLANDYYVIVNPTPPPDPNEIPDFSDAPDLLTIEPHEVFVAYCGVRQLASGERRIVIVTASWYAWNESLGLRAGSDRLDWQPGARSGRKSHCEVATPDKSFLRLFAGQPHAADPSKFTLRYVTSLGEGLVEGTMVADGDIDLKVVSGPLTPQPSELLPEILRMPGQ